MNLARTIKRTMILIATILLLIASPEAMATPDLSFYTNGDDDLPNTARIGGTLGRGSGYPIAVFNRGSSAAGGFFVGVYFSSDEIHDPDDHELERFYVESLAPGEPFVVPIDSIVIPDIPPGFYWLQVIADVDDQVAESDEHESSNWLAEFCAVSGGEIEMLPDYRLSKWSNLLPRVASAGEPVGDNFRGTLSNYGNVAAGESSAGFYLSTVFPIDESSRLLVRYAVPALEVGEGFVLPLPSLVIPADVMPSSYYLVLVPDDLNEVAEASEDDQYKWHVEVTNPPEPELACVLEASLDGSSFAFAVEAQVGDMVTLRLRALNTGEAEFENVLVDILAADGFGPLEVLSGAGCATMSQSISCDLGQLLPGEAKEVLYRTQLLSAQPGDVLEHGAVALGSTASGQEAMTTGQAIVLTTNSTPPDLYVNSLSGPQQAFPGMQIRDQMSILVNNNGGAAGAFFIGVYLSEDAEITTSDRLLIGGREYLASMEPGELVDLLLTGETIPSDIPEGYYYLGVLIDEFDSVAESNEDNNTSILPITIGNPQPACLAGSVGAGNGALEDILLVNGDRGGDDRTVERGAGEPIVAEMRLPAAGGNGKYAIHGNLARPTTATETPLPAQIGTMCFPLLPSQGANPAGVWNCIGKPERLGASQALDGTPIENPALAPNAFLTLPQGDFDNLPVGTALTLQGIVIDLGSASAKRVSVTNGVVIQIW